MSVHTLPDSRKGPLHGSGDPPTIDPMEPRVAKLESDVEYIKRDIGEVKAEIKDLRKEHQADFRLTFGAIIVTALGLAGLMAKGFHWL